MRKRLVGACCLAAMAAIPLWAQQRVFQSVKATPDRIQTGQATVTVEAVLAQGVAANRLTVRLERVRADGSAQALGVFRNDGGRLTLAVTFREQAPGRIQLRAAAIASTPAAAAAPQPSYSDPLFIAVARAGPPVRPQPVTQQARGFRATVPEGFVWNTKVAGAGGPWSINNFGSQYLRGGVIPEGGCEIEGTSGPARISAAEQLKKDIPGVPAREASANGHPALRVQQDEEVAPGLTYRTLSAYISAGQSTYKLFATFRAGDGVEAACRAAFDRVLASFTPSGGR